MSTRATYLLPASLYVGHSVCIYVHSDGYPARAANYFLAMHALKNKTGGLACQFLRAVDSAEITLDQDAHDDTEYHYEIDRKGLLMGWKRNIQSREWERLYTGKWYDFVNLYLKLDKEQQLYLFKTQYDHRIMTLEQAKAFLSDIKTKAEAAFSRNCDREGESLLYRARVFEEQLNMLQTDI